MKCGGFECCSGELEPGGCSILVTKGCGFQPSENRPMTDLAAHGSLCKATFLSERSHESRCIHLLGRTVYFLTYNMRFTHLVHNSQYIVTINQEQ